MPNDVFKNTDGNIRQSVKLTTEPVVLTQVKRQQRISQNRQLTNRIISVEVLKIIDYNKFILCEVFFYLRWKIK